VGPVICWQCTLHPNAPVGVAAKSRKPWIQLPVFIRAPVNVTVQRHPERHPPWSTHCGASAESLSTCTVFVSNLEPCEDLSPLPAHEPSGGPWLAAVLSPYGKHDVVPSHAEPQHDPWHRRPFNARHTLTSRTSSPARSAIEDTRRLRQLCTNNPHTCTIDANVTLTLLCRATWRS